MKLVSSNLFTSNLLQIYSFYLIVKQLCVDSSLFAQMLSVLSARHCSLLVNARLLIDEEVYVVLADYSARVRSMPSPAEVMGGGDKNTR